MPHGKIRKSMHPDSLKLYVLQQNISTIHLKQGNSLLYRLGHIFFNFVKRASKLIPLTLAIFVPNF